MGYDVEANEMSYHQLLASHFMLNNATKLPGFQLSPWELSFSNHVRREDQFEVVTVPNSQAQVKQDNSHDGSKQGGKFVLNPAEFTTAYNSAEYASHFDLVVTMFFIDTAPNFLDYIRTISHTLKSGGCWINVGPLLWNCAENGPAGRGEGDADEDEAAKVRTGELMQGDGEEGGEGVWGKLELTHKDVIKLLVEMGFEVLIEDEQAGEAGYVIDEKSMLKNVYQLAHWVVRKE